MESRPLIIQIPKPDEEGYCEVNCPLYGRKDCGYSKRIYNRQFFMMVPGPGCPWYDGGKNN